MKIVKSLTCLIAVLLVSDCNGHSSATFSSLQSSSSSETIISSNEPSSYASSESSVISTSQSSSSIISSSSTQSSSSVVSSSSTQSSSSVISSSSSASSSSASSSSSSSSSSQYTGDSPYEGYYDSLVSWTDGEDLKNQLNAIIRNGYTPLSYTKSSKQNYDTNVHADHSKYDFEYLDVIYSKNHTFKTETNKGWQREHAWCASLMCGSTTGEAIKQKGRATDFHNLFAANASGNQSRGNKNYGYADVFSTTYTNQYMTDNGNDGYSYDEITFEPGDIDKGRLARAIFYMATMYKDDEVDTANNINMKGLQIVENPVPYIAGNNCYFAIGNLIDLLEWNEDVPVDYLEMQHNISVYTDSDNPDGVAQGNRNPYVDYPELVDYVYGSKKNQAGSLNSLTPSITNLVNTEQTAFHHAIKEAKREYGYGETLSGGDYKIVSVLDDFRVLDASMVSSIFNSLDGYTFTESDGNSIEATIVTLSNRINYQITLNPMGLCNSGILPITTTGINKKTPNVDQNVSFGSVPFLFNFSTSYSDVTTTGMTINNNTSDGGGILIGSNNRVLTKLVVTTKNSYTIDSLFIKAKAGNAGSAYSLQIKVGDTLVKSSVVGDNVNWKVVGGALDEPLTGQISFTFQGSTALKIHSIAFNSILS